MKNVQSVAFAGLLLMLAGWGFVGHLYAGGGAPSFTKHSVDTAFDRFHAVHAADVDGDGDVDILGASFGDDVILWWENQSGDGTEWSEHVIDDFFWVAISVHGADVDGDGDIDVLGAAFVDSDITWWENIAGDGTAWLEHTLNGNFEGANSVRAADMDGDGDQDVVGSAQDADSIAWWENASGDGGTWIEHLVDGSIVSARSVYPADVDGDGDLDITGAAFEINQMAWWENTTGDGTAWTRHVVDNQFQVANFVHAGDLDGDGDVDIIGAAERDDEIAWWENAAGDGTAWIKHTVDNFFDQANSVHSADVDGDGDLDILGTALQANDIAWWENTAGNGTVWNEHTLDGGFDGISVHTADIDGDGNLDILGAAVAPGEIAWWENDDPDGFPMNPGLNGNWWKGLDRNGEGVQIEVADAGDGGLVFVATFYSYDTMGKQIFLVAVGNADGSTAHVDVFITEGGVWGNNFDPALVSEMQWGTGTFTAISCESIHMALMPNSEFQGRGYTELQYDLTRLTTPAIPCPTQSPN